MAAKRRTVKTSVVSTSPARNNRTHGTIGGAQHPVIAEERAPKRSADARQLAPLQVRSSKFPGGMGEERRTAYVANKINEGKATNHLPESAAVLTSTILPSPQTPPIPSPEPSVVLMPPIPISPPVLRRLFDESTSATKTVVEQRANDVVSKNKTNVNERSPKGLTPVPLSAHQAQTTPPCQIDELESPVDNAPSQRAYDVPNHSAPHGTCIVSPKHPSRDMRLPMLETSGKHLERAAAYIRERMYRRSSACDAFVPRACKDPPDKPVETDARQIGQDIVSVNTTSVALHSPDNLATFELLVPESEPSPPSTSVSPASPNNDLISKEDQLIVTQTRYNNETYKVEIETHEYRRVLDDVNGGNEASGTRLHKVENEDVKPLHSYAGPVTHQPVPMDTSPPIVKTQGGEDELLEAAEVRCPKDWELAHRVPEHSEPRDTAINLCQWASQEVVNKTRSSVLTHSREYDVALTLPTPAPANALPPYSRSRSSPTPESRLRWKPPDTGEDSSRHAYRAVNDRLQPSAIEHLLRHGAAAPPPVTRLSFAHITKVVPPCCPRLPPSWQIYTLPAWTGTHRLLSVELVWRARCKPPNIGGETQQPSTTVVSANDNTGATRPPLHGAALRLPVLSLASPARVINTRRPHNELGWRVRKPPDATGRWLLIEAINKTEEGQKRGHLPIPRPTPAPFAHLPLRWSALTSLADRYVRETFVNPRANGKGCF